MRISIAGLALSSLLAASAGTAETQGQTIAGLTPSQRPAKAPVLTEMLKDAAWYARALTGVDQPYPASLRFLEDQGAWFSPFVHPGMTGPYDIRHWHQSN